ncbi:MAG: hypothetical protein ACI92Z_000563 [Paracoccaceae bacterium]|jgi:hypothetical protein
MTMNDFDRGSHDDLDDLFAAAKRDTHDVPAGLMARMLNDAGQVQDGFDADIPARAAAPGLFRGLHEMLGGWPAMAGLMTACTAGIWLGFSPPDALPDAFVLSGLLQEDLDMFDADGLTAGWVEYSSFIEGSIAE